MAIRVLVVSHLYPREDDPIIGSFVADQVAALCSAGVEVAVVSPSPWVPPVLRFASKRYRLVHDYNRAPREFSGRTVEPATYLAVPRNRLFWLGGPTLAWTLERLPYLEHAERSFDLVHAHVVLPDGFGAVKWGHRHGLPVICTAHGNDINFDPHFNRLTLAETRWTIRSADAMVAVSGALQDRMLRLSTPKRHQVIPSGIDPGAFGRMSRPEARSELGLPPSRPIVLFVGSLLPVKGIHTLLTAFVGIRNQVPESLLVLVGEGPLRGELESTAVELGISGSVLFAGNAARASVPVWMSAANLLVLPSVNEGMPLVVLEAMASGLPVVASDVGGIGEALAAEAGLLAPPGDAEALSSAVVRVLTDENLRRRLSERGKSRAALFSWKANAQRTIALYAEVLRDGDRHRPFIR